MGDQQQLEVLALLVTQWSKQLWHAAATSVTVFCVCP